MDPDHALASMSPGRGASTPVHVFSAPRRQPASDADLQTAADYILADCFLSVGQAIEDRKSVDHAVVIWWRDRYRAKFLRAMHAFGNTWIDDRSRVTAMCRMLGHRAAQYAGDRSSIDLASAMKASADVERFCVRQAERKRRRAGDAAGGDDITMYAGIWCAL